MFLLYTIGVKDKFRPSLFDMLFDICQGRKCAIMVRS